MTRIPQSKIHVTVGVHKRTLLRAYDRLKALCVYAVNPAQKQRYLIRWATWWHHAVGLNITDLLYYWISVAAGGFPATVWVGVDCYWQLIFPFDPSSKSKF